MRPLLDARMLRKDLSRSRVAARSSTSYASVCEDIDLGQQSNTDRVYSSLRPEKLNVVIVNVSVGSVSWDLCLDFSHLFVMGMSSIIASWARSMTRKSCANDIKSV